MQIAATEPMSKGGIPSLAYISPAVPAERMLANMRSSIGRGLPMAIPCKPHNYLLSVAAGGPSLADTYTDLTGVIATANGSLGWLKSKGVQPHLCAIMDAGSHIADMIAVDPRVRYYVASICDPAVFDKLSGCDVQIWHVTPDSIEDPMGAVEILDSAYRQWHAIGGACTMGARWIDFGYFLGFRRFNMHGLDSSFRGTSTHAYPDRADAKEWMTFRGRATRPNFLAQLVDFFATVNRMREQEPSVTIEVFGDGLLQDEWKRRKSIAWPDGDRHGHHIIAECEFLIEAILPHAKRRGVAVQAGGNVGILPKLLAEHFGEVYTYEPDPENFACLRRNVTEANVIARRAGLGNKASMTGIGRNPENCGQSHIVEGDDVPVVRIDELGLAVCDLIALDVEGYELPALMGAAKTIARCRPLIVVEETSLGARYGIEKGAAVDWLVDTFGYGVVGTHGRDFILRAD